MTRESTDIAGERRNSVLGIEVTGALTCCILPELEVEPFVTPGDCSCWACNTALRGITGCLCRDEVERLEELRFTGPGGRLDGDCGDNCGDRSELMSMFAAAVEMLEIDEGAASWHGNLCQ